VESAVSLAKGVGEGMGLGETPGVGETPGTGETPGAGSNVDTPSAGAGEPGTGEPAAEGEGIDDNPDQATPEDNPSNSEPDPLTEQRQKLVRLLHKRELGLDPAQGANDPAKADNSFRPNEAETASKVEAAIHKRLSRSQSGGDWQDPAGKTYDAVGPVKPKYFNLDSFKNQIEGHLTRKVGIDKVVIDVSGLTEQQVLDVENYVRSLDPSLQNRVIMIYQ
jgi:hypothetical protein